MKESRCWFARFLWLLTKSVPAIALGLLAPCRNESKKSSLQTFPSPMQPSPHSQGQLQGQHRRENTNPSVSSPRPLSTGPASKRRPPGFASVLQYFFLPAYAGRSQRCRKICTNPEVLRILFLLSPHPKNPSHNTLLISAD